MTQQRQPGLHWISKSQQETQEKSSAVPLSTEWRSVKMKTWDQQSIAEPAMRARHHLHCVLLYAPRHHVSSQESSLPWVLPQQNTESVLAKLHLRLCQLTYPETSLHSGNWRPAKAARSRQNITRRLLVHLSLWSHEKQWPINNGHQYHYNCIGITITNTSLVYCLLGFIYIPSKHQVSSHASTLAKHPFTCVCFSKTSFDTTDFPQKTEDFASRTAMFLSLETWVWLPEPFIPLDYNIW